MVLNSKSSRVYTSSTTVDTQAPFTEDEKGSFFSSTISDGDRKFNISRDIIVVDILVGREFSWFVGMVGKRGIRRLTCWQLLYPSLSCRAATYYDANKAKEYGICILDLPNQAGKYKAMRWLSTGLHMKVRQAYQEGQDVSQCDNSHGSARGTIITAPKYI
jgi:hypothetical protein